MSVAVILAKNCILVKAAMESFSGLCHSLCRGESWNGASLRKNKIWQFHLLALRCHRRYRGHYAAFYLRDFYLHFQVLESEMCTTTGASTRGTALIDEGDKV